MTWRSPLDEKFSSPVPRRTRLLAELAREGVTDLTVLDALDKTPREAFVPASLVREAYDNNALPIGLGQTISQPLIVGLMTQALALDGDMEVLEIGTGSGYQAAVLARLCRKVYTIERHKKLHEEAVLRFQRLGLDTIEARLGDGTQGWPGHGSFPRIMVTAAATDIPQPLLAQLAIGGVMVLPLGDRAGVAQDLILVSKSADGLKTRHLCPVRFVPLVAGLLPER